MYILAVRKRVKIYQETYTGYVTRTLRNRMTLFHESSDRNLVLMLYHSDILSYFVLFCVTNLGSGRNFDFELDGELLVRASFSAGL